MDTMEILYLNFLWFIEFRSSRTSTSEAESSGVPTEVHTFETIEKIHDMVGAQRRLKDLAKMCIIGISLGSVVSMILVYLKAIRIMGAAIAHNYNQVTTSDRDFVGKRVCQSTKLRFLGCS